MFQQFIQSATGEQLTEEEIREGDFDEDTFFVESGTGRRIPAGEFGAISGPEDEPSDTEPGVLTSDDAREDVEDLERFTDEERRRRERLEEAREEREERESEAERLEERRETAQRGVTGVESVEDLDIFEAGELAVQNLTEGGRISESEARQRLGLLGETAEDIEDEQREKIMRLAERQLREGRREVARIAGEEFNTSEMTSSQTQFLKSISESDSQIETLQNELDEIRVERSEANQALIESIRDQYQRRREEVKEATKRSVESRERTLARTGTQRFANTIAGGIISEEERQGLEQLRALDKEETQLILEAQQAQSDQDFELLSEKITLARDKRDEKIELLKEQQEKAFERNQEVRDRAKQIQRESVASSLFNQGVEDPNEIVTQVNSIIPDNPMTTEEASNLVDDLKTEENAIDASGSVGQFQDAKNLGLIPEDMGYFEFVQQENSIEAQANNESAKNTLKIQSAVSSDPQFPTFIELSNSFNSVVTGFQQNNSSGDIAMIAGVAKLVDPGSVVRPSEFETVQGALGRLEALGLELGDRLTEGRRLTDRLRQDFVDLASNLALNKAQPIKTTLERKFEPLANQLGVDFGTAVPEIRQMENTLNQARQLRSDGGGGADLNQGEVSFVKGGERIVFEQGEISQEEIEQLQEEGWSQE